MGYSEVKYIVSDEHKFIYFVVQKVACTSIKNALLPLFDDDATGNDPGQQGGPFKPDIHKFFNNSGHQIRKRQVVAGLDNKYRGYFKFAFVRNPWDRLVSCYLDKLAEGRPGMEAPPDLASKVYPGMPFAQFVKIVSETPDKEANIHFRSQSSVICGRGKHKPIMADFVGRFESLARDFDTVVDRIDDSRVHKLPHLMHAKERRSRPYHEFYDKRLRDFVAERYEEDINIFGYSF